MDADWNVASYHGPRTDGVGLGAALERRLGTDAVALCRVDTAEGLLRFRVARGGVPGLLVWAPTAGRAGTANSPAGGAPAHPGGRVRPPAALGRGALGVADRTGVAGVVRAWGAGRRAGGSLKVLAGARLVFADGTPDLICYPSDRAALGRLTRLLTLGKRRAPKGGCDLSLGDFLDHSEGPLGIVPVSFSPLRAPETLLDLVCRLFRS